MSIKVKLPELMAERKKIGKNSILHLAEEVLILNGKDTIGLERTVNLKTL